MAEKNNTIWFWIGGGCLALLLLTAMGVASIAYFGYSQVQQVRNDMADPTARSERAAQLLGLEELPEGYSATFAFSVSRFVKTVILSSEGDPSEDAEGDEALLLYLQIPPKQKPEFMAYMRGETDDPRVLADQGVQMRLEDPADHGEFEGRGGRILWVTHYGDLNIDVGDFAGLEEAFEQAEEAKREAEGSEPAEEDGDEASDSRRRDRSFTRHGEGTTTLFTPLCEDRRSRIGFWSGPHEIPGRPERHREPPDPAELIGSTGDPTRIEAFLRDMDLCR